MKFAHPHWLAGTGLALVVAALLIVAGLRLTRDVRRFGDAQLIGTLLTGRSGGMRAFKGVLLVLGVAAAFLALAQPQYGRGTRLIPATNLDVVIVLDYSKSMYARDVKPNRTERSKTEVGRLLTDLAGARFAAVAFAGDAMKFPLTSDSAAINQFLRQLTPNDMPVGGTAIARALEAGRDLLRRDPLSAKHRKVMVLITDGEDLEGDPTRVARSAGAEGVEIHVVQIGGRTPEPIPEVNEDGEVVGYRRDRQNRPLTTSLSQVGEAQLTQIAELSNGSVVRATRGETGLSEVTKRLKSLMTGELSEKVETVYADVFHIPALLALILLVLEALLPELWSRGAPRPTQSPPPKKRHRRTGRRRAAASATAALLIGGVGCEQLDPWFERESPEVGLALDELDAGSTAEATQRLQRYLSTGKCEAGNIGTPAEIRDRPEGSFDLGIALFRLSETFGQRFGEELTEEQAADPAVAGKLGERGEQIDCALRIVRVLAADQQISIARRARSYYLAGNLEFLRGNLEDAVTHYNDALALIPGFPEDAGDGVGRDAAWNRAIALLRIQEKEDEEPDAGDDASPDAGDASEDAPPDGSDGGGDSADDGGGDGGGDGAGDDASDDAESDASEPPPDSGDDEPDSGQSSPPPAPEEPPPTSVNQDESMLDMLEQAPTFQREDARRRALQSKRRLEDK